MLEERLASERMRQDLDVARSIQAKILPERPLEREGYSMRGRVVPAAETGGDYFDFFMTRVGGSEDKLFMAVGDVSGHGIGAALVMSGGARLPARLLGQLALAAHDPAPHEPRAGPGPRRGHVHVDVPVRARPAHARVHLRERRAHAPGAAARRDARDRGLPRHGHRARRRAEMDYEERGPFKLEPGDTVLMFSDGLTELRRGDELYSRAGSSSRSSRHGRHGADELLRGVFDDAESWAGDAFAPMDDVTVAVLRADR
jgi:sigma-B regulation protein RsbU (phosphoserine phosphatase)